MGVRWWGRSSWAFASGLGPSDLQPPVPEHAAPAQSTAETPAPAPWCEQGSGAEDTAMPS